MNHYLIHKSYEVLLKMFSPTSSWIYLNFSITTTLRSQPLWTLYSNCEKPSSSDTCTYALGVLTLLVILYKCVVNFSYM